MNKVFNNIKKLFAAAGLGLLGLFTLASCGDDPEPTPAPGTGGGTGGQTETEEKEDPVTVKELLANHKDIIYKNFNSLIKTNCAPVVMGIITIPEGLHLVLNYENEDATSITGATLVNVEITPEVINPIIYTVEVNVSCAKLISLKNLDKVIVSLNGGTEAPVVTEKSQLVKPLAKAFCTKENIAPTDLLGFYGNFKAENNKTSVRCAIVTKYAKYDLRYQLEGEFTMEEVVEKFNNNSLTNTSSKPKKEFGKTFIEAPEVTEATEAK